MTVDTSNSPLYAAPPTGWPATACPPRSRAIRIHNGAKRRQPGAAADRRGTRVADGRTRGAVFLEQAGDQLLALRDRAVTRLFDLTLMATAAAVIIMFGMATWISLRIGRCARPPIPPWVATGKSASTCRVLERR